jgi:aminopeptidase C
MNGEYLYNENMLIGGFLKCPPVPISRRFSYKYCDKEAELAIKLHITKKQTYKTYNTAVRTLIPHEITVFCCEF